MAASKLNHGDGSSRTSVPFRLGIFTRLVDDVAPGEVYARALRLFEVADALGFDTGWVAQHHAHKSGGLPSPLVFLTAAAARTRHLRLATGIVTLPLENPLRLAEDAAVLDALSGGRLELGFGTGGDADVSKAFGRDVEQRQTDYDRAFRLVRDALSGKPLTASGLVLFPPAVGLVSRLWEATFGVAGAIRAAEHGSGLLLSRTMARPGREGTSLGEDDGTSVAYPPLDEVQAPLLDAYLAHWTSGEARPRIGLSRSLYVAPTRAEALADAEEGLRRHAQLVGRRGVLNAGLSLEELLARTDFHIGDPEDVIASLRADRLLAVATDLILQVHPVDPPPEKTLRSLQLLATEVAPALGWRPARPVGEREPVTNIYR